MVCKKTLTSIVDCLSLVDVLRWRALHSPERQLYTFLVDGKVEDGLTYEDLDRRARAVGAFLQDVGIVEGRALLLYPPGLEYIVAFFGCLYAGVVAVPSYPPRLNKPAHRLQAIAADSQAAVALTTTDILSNLERRFIHTPRLKELHWLATDDVTCDLADAWRASEVDGDTLAFLQYTSGSTSMPKGVMVSHSNILYNERMIQEAFGHTDASTLVGWLPMYHDMGLIGNVLQPLYVGASCILMSPVDFLQNPFLWLEAVSRYRAHTSGGPNFGYDLCVTKVSPEQRESLDLSSWQVAFNGAEPVRYQTLERFGETFAPCGFRREAFYPCYGLAEATLFVSGNPKAVPANVQTLDDTALGQDRVVVAPDDGGGRTFVSCGRTWAGQRIVIVDPETMVRCSPDQIGEIWISGPNVAQGYWGKPEETAYTFQACHSDTGEGPFLRTGDLGFLKDGELFITGRIKDLIIIRGRNHYPQDIELTVEQSHLALRPSGGAAFSVEVKDEERLVVVQEVRRTHRKADVELVAQSVRQAVAAEHELQVYAVVLIKPMSIPKTSSGKIQRNRCRKLFLEGGLRVIGSSVLDTSPEHVRGDQSGTHFIRRALAAVDEPSAREALMVVYLQEQVARVLQMPPSKVESRQSLAVLGLDSLQAIELNHALESGLGVGLPVVDLLQGPSVAQLAERVLAAFAGSDDSPSAYIVPIDGKDSDAPLSWGQRAMWFLHELAPESAAYNIANAVRVVGELDVQALRQAFLALVDRHPSLRTTFSAPDGEPVQRVHARAAFELNVEDATSWSEHELSERLVEEANSPFDLEDAPLLRVHLFRRSAEEHVLLLVVHHIVADFWSLAVLVRELEALYLAREGRVPPLALQYTDYAYWQAQVLDGPPGERLWEYWRRQLGGRLPVLNLPTDRPRPAVSTYRGAARFIELDARRLQQLKALGQAHGATLYMVLLAAFQVLLHRYTGQDDILVGSPIAERERAELAGIVGYFVNPVVLRANLSGDLAFVEFLSQVRETVLEAFAHQEYPFELLVERLKPQRDVSRSPVFQAWFALQQAPISGHSGLNAFALGKPGARVPFGELWLESMAFEQGVAQFDLALTAAEVEGGLGLSLRYNSDLFEATTVERMLRHFDALLEGIAAEPGQRLAELPLLSADEIKQVLCEWNDTSMDYDREACLPELFESQVARVPEAVAAVFEDHRLTYRALNRRANKLARYLRSLGVSPGVRIGVCMERSLEMVVGLLGVLKAGGAYVPLDPAYPAERLCYVLEDSRALVLLTDGTVDLQDPRLADLPRCNLKEVGESIDREDETSPDVLVNPESLVYVIYTSGSTGRPKGVQIPHRALVNFLDSMRHEPGLAEQDVLLSVTTLSFDIAGLELFLPLTTGATLVLAGGDVVVDGRRLSALLIDCGATIMQATPSTWRLLLETGWASAGGLRVLCGGEAFPRDLANRLVEIAAAVWNMYGPTETTVWSTIYPVKAGERAVSIGRPIANTQVYLLDRHLNPVSVGMPGELYIGGDGLARGYFDRFGLTAEKFVPDPFGAEPGARMYRTGDLARFWPDGHIEFLGRIDHQVKIRGFRIEVGEVEAALGQHVAVQEAVVVARDAASTGKRLVAYVVPSRGLASTVSELRRFLGEKLPDYMVPSAFVMLEALPLTPNGKVDRRALPTVDGGRPDLEVAYTAPQAGLERRIAEVWQEVLQVEKVGAHDNVFELGGHSLLMARIQKQMLAKGLASELTIVELFQYPTVRSLAEYLDRSRDVQSVQAGSERVDVRRARRTSMSRQRERRRASRRTNN
jgi:amino acid adenylation domain-containing protein